jgi:aryl-alcohol dehydrogenase-like predicted oxidoreductase
MKRQTLGASGLEVSVVGLGCNNFGGVMPSVDLEVARKVIHAALDEGITLFDTSDSYGMDGGSERTLGAVLGASRHDIVLATKFGSPMNREKSLRYNASRHYIMRAVEDSLRRLDTDYIDLYQLHFPDAQTPIEETLRALDDLVRQGKVRYVACSNLPAWQLVDAAWTARHYGLPKFLSTQAEYNLLARSAHSDLLPALEATNMSLLPYFPLASGLLTGKHRKGQPSPEGTRMENAYFKKQMSERNLELVEALLGFCERRGRHIVELAFSWLSVQPRVASVIAGATSAEQVRQNARAVTWEFTREELSEIDALTAEK